MSIPTPGNLLHARETPESPRRIGTLGGCVGTPNPRVGEGVHGNAHGIVGEHQEHVGAADIVSLPMRVGGLGLNTHGTSSLLGLVGRRFADGGPAIGRSGQEFSTGW